MTLLRANKRFAAPRNDLDHWRRDWMARMGHSTATAALIYQRARREREREIAASVSARVEKALGKRAK